MKIYVKEPTPCSTGYEPVLTYYKLMERRRGKSQVGFEYFENIENTSKYTKNAFGKILDARNEIVFHPEGR